MSMPEGSTLTPDLKALLGREWVYTSPEEIGRASIRKFALSLGDDNPLYSDQEHARKTKYGGIIAPPTLVCETMQYMVGELDESGGPVQKPRVSLGAEIRGGNEYTFFRPLRPDDVLRVRWKVADIREREGRSGKLIILVSEITYANQHGEMLAVNEETTIFRDSGSQVEGSVRSSGPRTVNHAIPGQAMEVRVLERPLYFEEVQVGDEVTTLCKEITLAQMVFYAAATWDFHRYHYDHEYVRQRGYAQPFVDGQMLGAFLAQMLADWAGDPGAIGALGFRFRDFAFPGDVLTCKGCVTSKSAEGGQNRVVCDLWIDNQEGSSVLSPGHASLNLPSRGS